MILQKLAIFFFFLKTMAQGLFASHASTCCYSLQHVPIDSITSRML